MSAADLARLELAKRAYKATEPGEAEILAGVRRARLSLTRPKPRRAWFSKGLVFVVLAVGSLAYAKPQALGELIERALPQQDAAGNKRLLPGVASVPAQAASQTSNGLRLRRSANTAHETAQLPPPVAGSAKPAAARLPAVGSARSASALPNQGSSALVGSTARKEPAPAKPASAMTDWGRVGQALARGDNTEALSALSELSASDDQRTRDKADLGRAQLLMAHGEPDEACALARSLTHRRAGGRIERQAQLLLKSCGR